MGVERFFQSEAGRAGHSGVTAGEEGRVWVGRAAVGMTDRQEGPKGRGREGGAAVAPGPQALRGGHSGGSRAPGQPCRVDVPPQSAPRDPLSERPPPPPVSLSCTVPASFPCGGSCFLRNGEGPARSGLRPRHQLPPPLRLPRAGQVSSPGCCTHSLPVWSQRRSDVSLPPRTGKTPLAYR